MRAVSKNDEFCIKHQELCTKNKVLCIKNDEFCSGTAMAPGADTVVKNCSLTGDFILQMMNSVSKMMNFV